LCETELYRVIGGPGGDYTITATGSLEWKETITVKKKSTTDHEDTETESYFFQVRVRQNN
jgi:hypothetical protein